MNSHPQHFDVAIVGGGLAGLVNAILLSRSGFEVVLLEKKIYPFHKVCGEYVSNEVLYFLRSIGFDPFQYGASTISKLRMTSQNGTELHASLEMGGFGLSRYIMDHALAKIASESGVKLVQDCRVNSVLYDGKIFNVEASASSFTANFVIASHGKRELLDKKLDRPFMEKHTGYMGVKYHIKCNYPVDEIGLFHFDGGYCGIVGIEDDKYNLCYLYRRSERFRFHEIAELENKVIGRNPVLKKIFSDSYFVDETPLVINELYFEKKTCVQDHILFCGDSAGLITPLCGNGMSMAIHGAAILSDVIIRNVIPGTHLDEKLRSNIESEYSSNWKSAFSTRLTAGRLLQKLSGKNVLTANLFRLMNGLPFLKKAVIRSTHGKILQAFIPKSGHRFYQTSHQ